MQVYVGYLLLHNVLKALGRRCKDLAVRIVALKPITERKRLAI
jgi:hypothetical protein